MQIWLAEEIARHGGPLKGEVVFSFVTDEESIDCNGMAYLRESDALKPDMLLVAAPTNNTLIIAERGVLWLEINTVGKPAHAGEPSQGDNAISRMMRICTAIEAEMNQRLASRVSGDMRSTMNLGWFHGGENTNVVPSRCRVEIDRRLLPTETVDEAFAEIVAIVERVGEPDDMFEIRKIRGTNGFIGDQRSSFVTTMMSAIEDETGSIAAFTDAIGVSDGRYFADDGIDIVVFGPGDGNQGHAANETVEVAALSEGAFILHRAVADILGFAKDG